MIFGKKTVNSERPALIMGIVNATPDSFFEKSRGGIDLALKLIDEGADILDIGGESTRPGFTTVESNEEIMRVVPLVKEIRKHSDIPISIDTRKKNVMEEAFYAGADVLNDVSAMEYDEDICNFVSKNDLGVILMFGKSGGIKNAKEYLSQRINYAIKNNISKEKIIVDPGIGFDKTFEENIELIKNCGKLSEIIINQKDNDEIFNFPVLMALSNKRCIGAMTGNNVEDRDVGTMTANLFSVISGASIIRVHNVKQAVDSLNVMKFLK